MRIGAKAVSPVCRSGAPEPSLPELPGPLEPVPLEPAPDLQCLPEMPPLVRREKMKTRSNTEADTAYEWIWEPYPRQIEIRGGFPSRRSQAHVRLLAIAGFVKLFHLIDERRAQAPRQPGHRARSHRTRSSRFSRRHATSGGIG